MKKRKGCAAVGGTGVGGAEARGERNSRKRRSCRAPVSLDIQFQSDFLRASSPESVTKVRSRRRPRNRTDFDRFRRGQDRDPGAGVF